LGAVDGEDVNVSSFGDVLSEATCILGANVLMRIAEQVGDILSRGSKREVEICRKDSAKTEDRSK